MEFVHEDGKGNAYNEEGEEVVVIGMEVDNDNYPLNDVTDFDQYVDLKPPEKTASASKKRVYSNTTKESMTEDTSSPGTYRNYKKEDMDFFFFLINEKGMSIRGAATKLKIPHNTCYNWYKKSLEVGDDFVQQRKSGSGRPVGRPATLTDEHQDHLLQIVDDDAGLTLDQMLDRMTDKFADLKVSKSAFHTFVTKKCSITCKRAHFHSLERNSPEKIQERFEWVDYWHNHTDLDYENNCVFIDEAAFHINMKRTYAWSRKGTRAVVKTPKTRAKTTTILGAVSPHGVVNIKVRVPKVVSTASSKKRKVDGNSTAVSIVKGKGGTVTGHYFNFISSTLDIMDKYELFKGHYLIMDNVPIHKHEDIRNLIQVRGYGCIYLPSYSPELNPIEQFWSVCKSKLKREALLEEETLTTRIRDACNSVLLSDLKGFCKYSVDKFDVCLAKSPL